ncbi:MAG TPA: M20 family metallopeptidase [Candidatus Krumholzibacteriaceae bacterium]|nr:M20 family metallopeptidase [Candidatus Krumholzibacteriaceae bacterium]
MDQTVLSEALSRIDEARIVELAKELVRVPSVSGEERAVMHRARGLLEEIGVEAEFHGIEERPIISAVVNPGAERLLVFNGHLDVVPIAKQDAWTKAPWDPVLEDGRLYGRGASDMKSSCAVMIHVLEILKEMGLPLSVGVHLVPDEERGATFGSKVLVEKITRGEMRRPDYVVIGEQSNLKVRVAERGMFGFQVKFYGRAAHTAASRTMGINAIAKASKGVLALEHHIDKFHEWIGHPMQSVNIIEGGTVSNQVPAECTVTVDRRLVIGETADDVVAEVTADLDKAGEGDPDWSWEIVAPKDEEGNWVYTPANYTPPDSELGKAFMDAVPAALGVEPELYVEWAGSTDGRLYRQAGIQTIGFGPIGFGAHGPDEFVLVNSLVKTAKVYVALALRLAEG